MMTNVLGRLAAPFGDEEEYRCRSCATAFELRHHVCPECGSYAVERKLWQ